MKSFVLSCLSSNRSSMYILIAEDESLSANRLKKMVLSLLSQPLTIEIVDSVLELVEKLEGSAVPDLLLLDIHLADGSSLDIFQLVDLNSPVIFITAYDEHAVQAFRLNAIDYLLKPIKRKELEEALKRWQSSRHSPEKDYGPLAKSLKARENIHRFLIRIGRQLHLIEVADCAFFYTEDRICFLVDFNGKRYPLDQSLDSLESQLDSERFFRVNRQFIVQRKAIKELHAFSKSRVRLLLQEKPIVETIVSTERSPRFKEWLVS